MKRSIAVKFKQSDDAYCVSYELGSCVYFCGKKHEGGQVAHDAKIMKDLPRSAQLQWLEHRMAKFVPEIGRCKKFNVPTAGENIHWMNIQQLVNDKTPYPTLVVLHGNDGSISYAVSIW